MRKRGRKFIFSVKDGENVDRMSENKKKRWRRMRHLLNVRCLATEFEEFNITSNYSFFYEIGF